MKRTTKIFPSVGHFPLSFEMLWWSILLATMPNARPDERPQKTENKIRMTKNSYIRFDSIKWNIFSCAFVRKNKHCEHLANFLHTKEQHTSKYIISISYCIVNSFFKLFLILSAFEIICKCAQKRRRPIWKSERETERDMRSTERRDEIFAHCE